MQKDIKINSIDWTPLTPATGYEVKARYVYGGNTMTMQNGDTHKDEVAIKSDVTVPFLPLTDEQLSALMQSLYSKTTSTVYFFDPDYGYYRTMTAHRTIGSRRFRGMGADGRYYWTGVTVLFEER